MFLYLLAIFLAEIIVDFVVGILIVIAKKRKKSAILIILKKKNNLKKPTVDQFTKNQGVSKF